MNSEINDYFSSQVKVALGVLVVQKLSALQQKSSNLQVEVDELTNTIDTATEILKKELLVNYQILSLIFKLWIHKVYRLL